MAEAKADLTLIFETVHGSTAYGLARTGSDVDVKGIVVGPRRWFFGIRPAPEQVEVVKTDNVAWTVPLDEVTTRTFTVVRMAAGATPHGPLAIDDAPMYGGRSWKPLDAEGHQRSPGDDGVQVGQGRATLRSEEQLAASDRGVAMFRTLYTRATKGGAERRRPAVRCSVQA